jgi:hypothetical protein
MQDSQLSSVTSSLLIGYLWLCLLTILHLIQISAPNVNCSIEDSFTRLKCQVEQLVVFGRKEKRE